MTDQGGVPSHLQRSSTATTVGFVRPSGLADAVPSASMRWASSAKARRSQAPTN